MRNIPRGKPEYEALPTVFLNWDEMSSKLRADKFSGYIEVSGKEDNGFILFSEGRIAGSLFTTDSDEDLRGQRALSKTTMTIQGRKGNLSIYALEEKVCTLVQWYIQGNRLYTPMESVFINWDKFLGVMKDKSVTGFIRVASEEYTEFIKLENGVSKGHFISGNEGFEDKSEKLSSVLAGNKTKIEVFLKSDPSSVVAKLEPEKPAPTPTPTPAPAPDPKPEPKPRPEPVFEPKVKASDKDEITKKKPLIPPEEIPDPFAKMEEEGAVEFKGFDRLDKKDDTKPEAPPANQPGKAKHFSLSSKKEEKKPEPFKIPEKKPEPPKPELEPEKPKSKKTPTGGGQTMVSKPSGRVAFLLDGIRKVAQSNIGDDILPWLDGQISRIQSVNPKLTKRDLNLLVDEVERYVRQVRQNPSKATKLSSQLRHIIESFASDL